MSAPIYLPPRIFGQALRTYFLGLLLLIRCGTLSAEVITYSEDEFLATTSVNIESLNSRPATLLEIFSLVENQTKVEFLYATKQLPLKNKLMLESGGKITLARLFTLISTMTDVVFQRRGHKIIVRPQEKDDEIVFDNPTVPRLPSPGETT